MRKVRPSILVPICLTAFGATSAGAAYTVLDGGVADGGTISGRVTFDGTLPEPAMLTVDEDTEACGGDRLADNLLVSGDGGKKNVAAWPDDEHL